MLKANMPTVWRIEPIRNTSRNHPASKSLPTNGAKKYMQNNCMEPIQFIAEMLLDASW